MAAHTRLRERLLAQRKVLSSAQWLEDLGRRLSDNLAGQDIPESFAEKVGKLTGVRESAKGLSLGMGPKALVGRDTSGGDMRGTIAAFLRDYPQFRSRSKRRVFQEYPESVLRRSPWLRGQGETFEQIADRRQAWFNLPAAGKRRLQEEREGGRYGGALAAQAGLAPYFYGHDKSRAKWQAAGYAAGLVSSPQWVLTALELWERNDLPQVLVQFHARLKAPL
jgi:hypothetical protein